MGAFYELLIAGRPALVHFAGITGIWPKDRAILDPPVLLPLLLRFQRAAISQEAKKRLRSALCGHQNRLTPAAVLRGGDDDDSALDDSSVGTDSYRASEPSATSATASDGTSSWRAAAAAVLQWAWVQLAHEEFQDPDTLYLGALEKALLLQPRLAARRIQRRRQTVLQSLQALRLDPFFHKLLTAPLEKQLPRRRAHQSLSSRSASTSRLGTLTDRSRLGGRQQSLPSLLGLQAGPQTLSRTKVRTPTAQNPQGWLSGAIEAEPLPVITRPDAACTFFDKETSWNWLAPPENNSSLPKRYLVSSTSADISAPLQHSSHQFAMRQWVLKAERAVRSHCGAAP